MRTDIQKAKFTSLKNSIFYGMGFENKHLIGDGLIFSLTKIHGLKKVIIIKTTFSFAFN